MGFIYWRAGFSYWQVGFHFLAQGFLKLAEEGPLSWLVPCHRRMFTLVHVKQTLPCRTERFNQAAMERNVPVVFGHSAPCKIKASDSVQSIVRRDATKVFPPPFEKPSSEYTGS